MEQSWIWNTRCPHRTEIASRTIKKIGTYEKKYMQWEWTDKWRHLLFVPKNPHPVLRLIIQRLLFVRVTSFCFSLEWPTRPILPSAQVLVFYQMTGSFSFEWMAECQDPSFLLNDQILLFIRVTQLLLFVWMNDLVWRSCSMLPNDKILVFV